MHDCAGNCHSLALTTGELIRESFSEVAQSQSVEQVGGPPFRILGVVA
jgi:hypothetical protein